MVLKVICKLIYCESESILKNFYRKNGQKMGKNLAKISKYRQKWALDLRPQMFLALQNNEAWLYKDPIIRD